MSVKITLICSITLIDIIVIFESQISLVIGNENNTNLLKSKNLTEKLAAQPQEIKHIKLFCRNNTPNEIHCKNNNFQYKIKLNDKKFHSKNDIESIIKAVYQNVEKQWKNDLRNNSSVVGDSSIKKDNNNYYEDKNEDGNIVIKTQSVQHEQCTNNQSSKIANTTQGVTNVYKGYQLISLGLTSTPNVIVVTSGVQPAVPSNTEAAILLNKQPEKAENLKIHKPENTMVIECTPNYFGPVDQHPDIKLTNKYNVTDKIKPVVYSCRWQGKRDIQPSTVIFNIP